MFSVELIEVLKKTKGLTKDTQAAELIPSMTRANISHLKSGSRHLTEEQALFIANECGLCSDWVLVHLAEEKAKSEEAKQVWNTLAKKLTKSINATLLVLSLVFCGFGDNDGHKPVFA